MWLKGEKRLKSLVRFHSTNKIDNYNRGRGEKIQKNLQNKSKHKNKCFSWVTAVRVLSLTGSRSSPHLPRMPFNTVLISGPAVRAAQILIWSLYVFLPPTSTAIRTRAFSFVGALNDLFYIPQTQNLPSWLCGFNLQLVQLVGGFGSFSLVTLPWVSIMVLFPPLDMGCPLGFAPEAALEGCPCEGQVWR